MRQTNPSGDGASTVLMRSSSAPSASGKVTQAKKSKGGAGHSAAAGTPVSAQREENSFEPKCITAMACSAQVTLVAASAWSSVLSVSPPQSQ